MDLRKELLTTVLVIVALACTPGCSEGPAPVPGGQVQLDATGVAAISTPSAAPVITLTVYANLDDPDMQTFPNPDAAMIERQVRALNWRNSQQRPYVHLSRIEASGGSYLKLEVTQGTPNTDG